MIPKITEISNEEFCGDFNGSRPSISVDSKQEPHIIIDQGTSSELYIYHKINNNWSQSLFAKGEKGGKYNAGRLYMPHIEIDKNDRAWISCKFGVKEFGTMMGQGIWLLSDVTSNPVETWFRNVNVHKGNGNVSINKEDSSRGIVLGTLGNWQEVKENGDMGSNGSIKIGPSGEKIRFLISGISPSSEIWHAVIGGYSKSNNMYGWKKNGNAPWADKNKYPEMGSDMIHPSLGIDLKNPKMCYMSVVYKPGILINVWDGNKMLFPINNLPVISKKGNSGVDRFGPQWAPALEGGAYLTWTYGNKIRMVYIDQSGKSHKLASDNVICDGVRASLCTDDNGDIHLAYVWGGMKYRKIKMNDPVILTTTTTTTEAPIILTTTTTTEEPIIPTTTTTTTTDRYKTIWEIIKEILEKIFG